MAVFVPIGVIIIVVIVVLGLRHIRIQRALREDMLEMDTISPATSETSEIDTTDITLPKRRSNIMNTPVPSAPVLPPPLNPSPIHVPIIQQDASSSSEAQTDSTVREHHMFIHEESEITPVPDSSVSSNDQTSSMLSSFDQTLIPQSRVHSSTPTPASEHVTPDFSLNDTVISAQQAKENKDSTNLSPGSSEPPSLTRQNDTPSSHTGSSNPPSLSGTVDTQSAASVASADENVDDDDDKGGIAQKVLRSGKKY